MNLSIETSVECESWREVADLDGLIRQCLDAVLSETGDELREGAEVSLLLCDDARIRVLNAQFRGMDKPTNVLSFPGPEPLETAHGIGDIAIAYETVAREAAEQGKPLQHHLRHMVVHGFLHLLGYDHETDEEAEAMEADETRALARMGVADPYRELSTPEGH
ncbi:probable rRNA maturation factor [Rhodoblastus acidophilus]|uniref:Endoribonuclease YbeY n=1 Tax=Rhodoblastus acidophilus TaxID=1074 RepID=A0A212RLU2_RHOAC|nr:rRNA maturation RNase YbeY [Rhodoblastus acidophilus]PPQ39112.1 rRNA maturation RNase YbeY [Rhodoblastus acidophilus]RAI24180.1 rRNA maturation RNase YbeY [Rhodoblastus acidophilus]SNB73398.1 probable rRNA maturation factor [Rhodoblastus acidophilus]